jgi:hypothetical protein
MSPITKKPDCCVERSGFLKILKVATFGAKCEIEQSTKKCSILPQDETFGTCPCGLLAGQSPHLDVQTLPQHLPCAKLLWCSLQFEE